MSWVRIWIHLVFSTKGRIPFFNSEELREEIFKHIKENAERKNIWIDSINGYQEHIHCLVSLNKDQTVSQLAQLIKGESSYWINKNEIVKSKFFWQDDYWAVSVSESHLQLTREYIWNQPDHHKIKPFAEEVDEFMRKYGWSLIQGK